MDLKKNGGILFIEFHVAIKLLFVFLLLMFTSKSFCQYRVIADNKEDSMFCIKKYPFYDFQKKNEIFGTFVPEKAIKGKTNSLEKICLKVQSETYKYFKDSVNNCFLTIDVLVDDSGIIRGAVIPEKGENFYRISKYILSLLEKEQYYPAFNQKKSIAYTFHYVMKFPE